ncbi:MAG: UDP-glucose/GDP-mannose dehydrogenase family protein [Nitrospinae bacterium]|nr:UDP-glucose/GDP-mannose dehydrogenase family protein [Nitrospinota bacterium]
MNICVIGTGYVGLVTGTIFAELGNEVVCVDSAPEKIENLNRHIMPIYEPGLEELVERNHNEGRLKFSTDVKSGIEFSEIIFICVGTPSGGDGETDLSAVESVAKTIAVHMNGYKIIVNKSTVPVGTGDLVREIVRKNCVGGHGFDVVSNPEFLREGQAVNDALKPDRIVIGASEKQVAFRLLELYSSLQAPMIITDVYSAEIIKYASNSFLAMKISFINAISNLCEIVDADVEDVANGVGRDQRIGADFLNSGLGFGGSCFPKDVKSLLHTSEKLGYDFDMLRNVLEINDDRVSKFIDLIRRRFPEIKGKTFAALGLAFKPNTDDMRDAKSVEIITALSSAGANIRAFDPVAMPSAKKHLPANVTYCQNAYEACQGADAFMLITEWREFKLLNLEKIKQTMKSPVIFDGRNLYNPERKKRLGFEYYSLGRKAKTSNNGKGN